MSVWVGPLLATIFVVMRVILGESGSGAAVAKSPLANEPVTELRDYVNPILSAAAKKYQRKALAENTRLAYERDWRRFEDWCLRNGMKALPATPLTVEQYLADAAEAIDKRGEPIFAPSTMSRWLTSINVVHHRAGFGKPGLHPSVEQTMIGIRSDRQQPPVRRSPLLLDDIKTILASMSDESWPGAVAVRRDALALLIGFAGAFRRSELVDLTVADVSLHRIDGLHIRLRHSKGDQQSEGQTKAIPYGTSHESCGPCAYIRWRQLLDAADSQGRTGVMRAMRMSGAHIGHVCRSVVLPESDQDNHRPLLRPVSPAGEVGKDAVTGHALNLWIKRRAQGAGYPAKLLGGHSLRSGFVSQAVRAGSSTEAIMHQTGHKTNAMISLYAREFAPLENNAVTDLGL